MPQSLTRNRLLLAGVLVVGALLAMALTGGIAWRHGSFSKSVEIYAIADSAAAIAPGTVVRLSGVRVGEVRAIDLLPDLHVKVSMGIDAHLLDKLRSDARAQLTREQLRPAMIDIDPGTAPTSLDPHDPKIAFGGRGTLTDIADDLRNRLAPILDDLRQITGTLRGRQGDIASVLEHAATASGELARAAAEMHALVSTTRTQLAGIGDQSQTLLTQGNGAVARVGKLVEQVDTSLGVVNNALPALMSKADSTLGRLDAVAQDLRQISTAAATTLPGVLRAAPPLLDDAAELVQGARQNWLVRGLLPLAAAAELPISSHDAAVLRDVPAR